MDVTSTAPSSRPRTRKKLGEILQRAGIVSDEELRMALAEQKRTGERLGAVLIRLEMTSEQQLALTLAEQLAIPYVDFVESPPERSLLALIPRDVCQKKVCAPVRIEGNELTVAMADPLQYNLVQDLGFRTGYRIAQAVATRTDILNLLATAYPEPTPAALDRVLQPQAKRPGLSPSEGLTSTTARPLPRAGERSSSMATASREARPAPAPDPAEAESDTPIVDLANEILRGAIKSGASDIHVEPLEKGVLVRHRLDGLLKEAMDLPKWVQDGLTARLKILAGMDIAEKRLPQDGRIRLKNDDGSHSDFRASSLRTMYGEKIVLRLLQQSRGVPPLESLGFSEASLTALRRFLRYQHGVILVVGPTGSGKSTTLSSALQSIQSVRTNIVTVEDPIEYTLPGINQTQVHDKIKLSFAASLRSILRQDPDVILIGEIRDQETARIAMQAAQTGHLVLTTLHTDDAPSTVTRLTDIGIEPYIIASATIGVVAQRLVRKLCESCRERYLPPSDVLHALQLTPQEASTISFYRAVGCVKCNQTGYRGRTGIHEVLTMNDRLRRLIAQRASEEAIREAAQAAGMITLGEDAVAKVRAGLTTAEELLRVVTEVKEMRTVCPSCSGTIALDFVACPHCGTRVSGGCPGCHRALEPGWQYCPYCARAAGQGERRLAEVRERRDTGKVTEIKAGLAG